MGDSAAETLLEIEAIKQLKARYFRLMDTKDWEAFPDLFTEDVEIDVSRDAGEAGRVRGRDRFVAFVKQAVGTARTVHHGHMPEIELTGPASARGTWAMFDCVEFSNGAGLRGYGHYVERYAKQGGAWRIASMQITRLRIDRFEAPEGAGGER